MIIALMSVAIFAYYEFAPVKYALKQSDIEEIQISYYYVKWTQVTGASWKIIGDDNGFYDEEIYIIAEGEVPSVIENYDIASGDNTYICYGNLIGMGRIGDSEEPLPKYQFIGWDIVYPINRGSLNLLMPQGWLCRADF